jgi:hypothetical protein
LNFLKRGWSDQQLDVLQKKLKKGRWQAQDIILGLTIRGISKRAFLFLRKSGLVPLPGLSTLKRWIKDFQCPVGIQKQVFKGIYVKKKQPLVALQSKTSAQVVLSAR